jgi:membrane-associated protease RseP (regulator of RpoE activity)
MQKDVEQESISLTVLVTYCFRGVRKLAQEDEASSFFKILGVVNTEFHTKDAFLLEGVPTFIVYSDSQTADKLDRIRIKLRSEGLEMTVEQKGNELMLQVFPRATYVARSLRYSHPKMALILFIVTLGTVSISGYMTASSFVEILLLLGRISAKEASLTVWTQTSLYTATIMGTLGLHEMGHIIACRKHKVEATLPLFIPGIPGITPGTFGALIRQRSPALDRNQLFDIGVMGPLVGFLVAMVASIAGYSLSLPVTKVEYNFLVSKLGPGSVVYLPLLLAYLEEYLFFRHGAYTQILHPLAYAAWIATLVTFLNAFPIGQLDGGHVSRAVLGPTWHRRLGYAMIGLMVLSGWLPMAILVLLLVRTDHPGVFDERTPLSNSRKLVALVFAAMFIASFTPSPGSPLALLIYP